MLFLLLKSFIPIPDSAIKRDRRFCHHGERECKEREHRKKSHTEIMAGRFVIPQSKTILRGL
jgi:hypothetical protein